jgi:parallel beta-helix repeat protein
MRRRVFFRAAVVVATTGIGGGFVAPMAAHAAVACGQTITVSTTLDHDLHCPSGHGVNIGASNVTLDLGGHTVTGPAPAGAGLRGVGVLQNRTGVSVRNGVIRGFDQGVDVHPGASGTVLTSLVLDANGTGIRIGTGTSAGRVTNNVIVNTVQFSGIQMGGNGHLVENNAFHKGNGAGVFLSGNNNVVRGNRINEMGQNAISIGAFPSNPGPFVDNQVIGNQINGSGRVGNATSIVVSDGSGTRIEGNAVNGRRTTPGIFVLNSANTVVAGNSLANHSSTGILIRGSSTGTRVIGNQSAQNTFSGISVENGPTGTLVADNYVASNGSNGIDVRSASTTVARNTAVANGNLGIFAVAGVTDGGGNRAFNNGNPAQCSPNIACAAS